MGVERHKFCFSILHYKTYEDTKECINSIQHLKDWDNIVVVDNNSDNGSFEKLKEEFKSDRVHFIHNEENKGFANGNNTGYKYAKEKLQADFIAVMNNDTIIESDDIVQKSIKAYKEYKYSVLGPDIISLVDNDHQNPMVKCPLDISILKKRVFRYKILKLINRSFLYDFLSNNKKKKYNGMTHNNIENIVEDAQLHGSFLIYSPSYVNKEMKAFCDKTFLYCEEVLLYCYCKKKNYKTIYYPDIVVRHKEDSSTNAVFNKSRDKREFVFGNLIDSYSVLINFIKGKLEW